MNCTKLLISMIFLTINIIFQILGIIFIVAGILFTVHTRTYLSVNHFALYSVALGFIILLVSILGIYGAVKNDTCLLQWFIGVVTVINIVQMGLIINASWNITDKKTITKELEKQLVFTFNNKQIVKSIMWYVNKFLLELESVALGLLVIEVITVGIALVLIIFNGRQKSEDREPLLRDRQWEIIA